MLKMPRSICGLRLRREHLCIASTLIVPLMLVIFLPVVSVFILTVLALFGLTIAVFHISKDRDKCRHYCKICRDMLEDERKKHQAETKKENKQMISC
jgi:hypothetical protein